MPKPQYRRVMLKLSGESLLGKREHGISPETCDSIAQEIKEVKALGVELAIVIGGGNIFRGVAGSKRGLDRATGDYMGMLATVINALALQDALERAGVPTRVQSAIEMRAVAEPYIRGRAIRHLEKGRTILLAAGTGNPYFTTDTAAALRAMEIDAEVLIKATKVDGVFDKDPKIYPDAVRFERISFTEALNLRLGVMDATALALCRENDLPIIVLDLWQPGSVERAILGQPIGTLVSS